MVRQSIILYLLLINFTLAVTLIPIDEVKEVDIDSPSYITKCTKKIFTYSVSERKIFSIDEVTWEANPISADPIGDLRGMSCFNNQLILIFSNRKSIFYLDQSNHKFISKGRIPTETPIQDLSCFPTGCILISDSVYLSKNLTKWRQLPIPESIEVPDRASIKDQANPFREHYKSHYIAKGRYTRAILTDTSVHLLDSARSSVVTFDLESQGMRQWNSWGFWEGNTISPKSIALFSGKEDFIISDPASSLLSVYNSVGRYQGIIGYEDEPLEIGYGIRSVVDEQHYWIADYLGNRVLRLKLPIYSITSKTKVEGKTSNRLNLLNRKKPNLSNEMLTRCLNCHDGTKRNDLSFLSSSKHRHPINDQVNCTSCHRGHHEAPAASIKPLRSLLRMSPDRLCKSCHKDFSTKSNNHFNLKTVNSCMDCHKVHQSEAKLLKHTGSDTCLSCHKSTTIHHAPKFFGQDAKADFADAFSCLSCHSPHQTKKSHSFLRPKTCVQCHAVNQNHLSKTAHFLPAKSKSVCLNCHDPHRNQTSYQSKCIGCHDGRGQFHRTPILTADTDRAANIHLSSDNLISCETCHASHNKKINPNLLRNNDDLVLFCSTCHGTKSANLIDGFHRILNGKTEIKNEK